MILTVLIGDSPGKHANDRAFDDATGDALGDCLGVGDRRGLLGAFDTAVNLRDHLALERTEGVRDLLAVLANRGMAGEIAHIEGAIKTQTLRGVTTTIAPVAQMTGHILAVVCGEKPAALLGVPRGQRWKTTKHVSYIAIPAPNKRTKLWGSKYARRELIGKLALVLDCGGGDRRRVAICLGNLLDLGSMRDRIVPVRLEYHVNELADWYLRLHATGWKPGDPAAPPPWLARTLPPSPTDPDGGRVARSGSPEEAQASSRST